MKYNKYTIYAVPDISYAWRNLCDKINELTRYDTIFLPYPCSLKKHIFNYILGGEKYSFIENVLQQYYGYMYKKIYPRMIFLKCLRENINMLLDIRLRLLYSDIFEKFYNEMGEKIGFLSIKNIIRKRIDINEWIDILEELLSLGKQSIKKYVEKILSENGKCAIITGMNAADYYRRMIRKNVHAKIVYVLKPYYYRPIDILLRTYSLRDMDEMEIYELVKEHLEYISQYIIPSKNLEEAYIKWLKDKRSLREIYNGNPDYS